MIRQTPDIFLSYSRTDLTVAGKMAAALATAGHNVWWDQALNAGEVYDQVTETALREARLVIVLWSKAAVASDWVRSEATVALQRGALVPVMIEDCQRPVMFELRQSADLIGWKGNARDPRLAAFLGQVSRQLASPAGAAPPVDQAISALAGLSRRRLIGGAVGMAALAAVGFGAWTFMGGKPFGSGADDGTASVVVLPFANLSSDPEQAFFSDGIAEELRNALAQIQGLKVIGRVSSEKFRDTDDLSAAAATLGVDHVLTGSVRRSPTTIRISAQLVDGRTGVESWSQSYDQPIGDSLAIQSKIATSVVAALSAKLAKAAGTIAAGGTSNEKAQELFLKAQVLRRAGFSKSNLDGQLTLLDGALALDASYAEAWALKGNVTSDLTGYTTSDDDIARLDAAAIAASRRAVALAPTSGYARLSLAARYRDVLDMRRAIAEAEKAIALAPTDPSVISGVGFNRRYFDPDRAVVTTEAGLALDPLNPNVLANYCFALLAARQYREAAEAARQTMALSDNQIGGNGLVGAFIMLRNYKEAEANLRHVVVENTRRYQTAILDALRGDRLASDRSFAALRAVDGSDNFGVASVHAVRGETALALIALEEAYRRRESTLIQIAVIPFLETIRREPRFKAVRDAIIPPDLFVPPKRGRA